MNCPDLSLLVDVEAAADFRVLELVSHVDSCAACRDSLAEIEQLHLVTASAASITDEQADAIVEAVRPRAAARSRSGATAILLPASVFALSVCTALIALLGAGAMSGFDPHPVLAAVVALLVATVASRRLSTEAR